MRRAIAFLIAAVASAQTLLYVDCEAGSDAGSGSSSSPFLTLYAARNAIRALPRPLTAGVTVSITRGPCFPRDLGGAANFSHGVLTLDDAALDSGAPGAPIVWQAAAGAGTVLLSGGLPLPSGAAWAPYAPSPGCFSLPLASAPGFPAAFPLGSLTAGSLGQCANNKAELIVGSDPTVRARYPNIAADGAWQWMHSTSVPSATSITVADTRPIDKAWPSTAWLHGFYSEDWADSHCQLASVASCTGGAPNCSLLTTDASTPPVYGYTKGCRVMGEDLLEELDAVNESYIDTATRTVYYCPPGGSMASLPPLFLSMSSSVVSITGSDSAVRAPRAPHSVASGAEFLPRGVASGLPAVDPRDALGSGPVPSMVSYVTLRGLTISHARGVAVDANAVNTVALESLTVAGNGQLGVNLGDAWNSTLASSTVRATGCSSVHVSGGDTGALIGCGTSIVDNVISDFARVTRTYQPGIYWLGVGIEVRRNEIFNGPHSAILGVGNDCLFDSNYVHDVAYETDDSGGWYSGRSWVHRGNVINNNTFANIFQTERPALGAPPVQAVYLDDELSGQVVTNNNFVNVYNGILLGGGRDNIIVNNSFANLLSGGAMTFDNRGMNWQASSCAYTPANISASGQLVLDLFTIHYQQPPYATAYPQLPGLLSDSPCVPVNNLLANNTVCNATRFVDRNDSTIASWHSVAYNNVVTPVCAAAAAPAMRSAVRGAQRPAL